jgi:ketosteroid isomerase-like protein
MHIRRLLLPVLYILPGVAPLVHVAHADDAADRAALESAAQAWTKAFNARDPDAMVGLTTDDVVLMAPGMAAASGHKAVHATWARSLGAAQGQLSSATKEIVIAGSFAWRIAALTRKLPDGNKQSTQALEIWKRADGQWKLHRQMSSNLLAEPGMAPRPMPSQPVLDKQSN